MYVRLGLRRKCSMCVPTYALYPVTLTGLDVNFAFVKLYKTTNYVVTGDVILSYSMKIIEVLLNVV